MCFTYNNTNISYRASILTATTNARYRHTILFILDCIDMGLGESRWAPRSAQQASDPNSSSFAALASSILPSTPTSTDESHHIAPAQLWPKFSTVHIRSAGIQELEKCDRLLRRLKWKAVLLTMSFDHACSPALNANERTNTEIMFKLDFFEFFVLLERVLVHLLACLHITIPRTSTTTDANGNPTAIFATSGKVPIYSHRYHANLLEALDRPTNPIHSALGIGDVRVYLGVAKDCRNKWKSAGEPDSRADEGLYTLQSLDMSKMLPCILDGMDRARDIGWNVVQAHPPDPSTLVISSNGYVEMPMETEESAFEVVSDAMDWEEY
jgi:hypothetical protein